MRFTLSIIFSFFYLFSYSQDWLELQNRTRKLYETGKFEAAISTGNIAYKLASPTVSNHRKLRYGRLLTFLGLSYQSVGKLDSALFFHQNSADVALKYYGDKHYLYGTRLINVGITLRYLEKPKEAQSALEKGLPIIAKHWGTDNDNYRNGLMHCAKVCLQNEDFNLAEEYYQKAAKLFETKQQSTPVSINVGLANLYFKQEKLTDVVVCLEKAFLNYSQHNERDKSAISAIMNQLSIYYSQQKDYEKLWELYQLSEEKNIDNGIIFLKDYLYTSMNDNDFEVNEFTYNKWRIYCRNFKEVSKEKFLGLENTLSFMLLQYDENQIDSVLIIMDETFVPE